MVSGRHKKLGAGYVLAVQDMSVAELQLQWKTCTHPAALHKKYKKVPTLSHTTTRTTTTTATSRKKKSNKNFYVMSLSLICGTCRRPCTAQCTTDHRRASNLSPKQNRRRVMSEGGLRSEEGGRRRGCHLGGFEELVFALSFYAWFDLNSLLAHCTLRVLPSRTRLSPPHTRTHSHVL